jgi:hypothetical protein
MRNIENPNITDVRPGVILGWRDMGQRRVRYFLVSRVEQSEAMVNRDSCLWVYGMLVRKNGDQSTAHDKTGGLLWLAEGEIVSVAVVDAEGAHAEALDEAARREMAEAAAEQRTARYAAFRAAVFKVKSYRGALDLLRAEAQVEDDRRSIAAARQGAPQAGQATIEAIVRADHAAALIEYGPTTRTQHLASVAGRALYEGEI